MDGLLQLGCTTTSLAQSMPFGGRPPQHGELLRLGIEVAQSTVSKYMPKGGRPSGQTWWTFLRNHADGIASIDLFVVPTVTQAAIRSCHYATFATSDRILRGDRASDSGIGWRVRFPKRSPGVGTTIWFEASMMACLRSTSPPAFSAISRWVLMFSIITVASSTRMPTASASPPAS